MKCPYLHYIIPGVAGIKLWAIDYILFYFGVDQLILDSHGEWRGTYGDSYLRQLEKHL